MSAPFCDCEVCAYIHTQDPKHVVREAEHAVVEPESDEHGWYGLALCNEHYHDRQRTRAGRSAQEFGGVQ